MELDVTAYVKTRKEGKSLVVTLPKEIVELVDIRPRDTIMITVDKVRPDFFGKCRGIGRFSEEDRMKCHN